MTQPLLEKDFYSGTFDAYVIAARQVFEYFCSSFGLGFVVVHDDERGALVVRELVKVDMNPRDR